MKKMVLCMIGVGILTMAGDAAGIEDEITGLRERIEEFAFGEIDESVLDEVEFRTFQKEIEQTFDKWLEDRTLKEIEKRVGPDMRQDAVNGSEEEQLWAQFILLEIAERIADQFPEVRDPGTNQVTYSAGRALIFTGRPEVGIRTLLREGYCLQAPAMICMDILYRSGMTDDDTGEEIIEQYDPHILKYWQDMAELGIPRAQLLLGEVYYEGLGVPVDRKRGMQLLDASDLPEGDMILGTLYYQDNDLDGAADCWRKAAENANVAQAWYNLGVLALEDNRFDEALPLLKKALAADTEYNPARIDLGRMYIEGWGVERNLTLAANLMKIVIRTEKEDARTRALGEYNLGLAMRHMRGPSEKELEKRFLETDRKAEEGNPDAMAKLGKMYSNGRGTEADIPKALELWRKAASAGNAEAMWCLGAAYEEGAEVEVDTDKAIAWYRKAAAVGSPEAMFNLGQMHAYGNGVELDGAKAVEWYKKAAAAGYVDALYELGAIYTDGRALPQDYGECIKWYRKAANAGHSEAMTYLGVRYMEGQGAEQDHDVAAEWFRKAALLGNTKGMLSLAGCHQEGLGVPRDLSETYIWLSLAVRSGYLDAYQIRDEIAKELSSA